MAFVKIICRRIAFHHSQLRMYPLLSVDVQPAPAETGESNQIAEANFGVPPSNNLYVLTMKRYWQQKIVE